MVKKVKINPTGIRPTISLSFTGLIVASYEFLLWESQSNEIVIKECGNNQNPYDDTYQLPMPVNSNIGRLIDIRTRFVGLDPTNSKNFEVKAEIFQGEKLDEAVETGAIDGSSQLSQIYILIES